MDTIGLKFYFKPHFLVNIYTYIFVNTLILLMEIMLRQID